MSDKKTIAVTGKITSEDFDLLNQKIQENPLLNKSNIVSQAISNYLHNKNGSPEAEKAIESLKNENEKLKVQVKNLTEEKTGLENKINELSEALANQPAADPEALKAIETLKTENESLKNEVEKLKNQPPKTLKLSENQIIVNVPPSIQPFLIEVTNRESNRTGRKITPGMIFLNLFWAQISKGPGDHLPMTFSSAEIRRRLEIVKQTQKPAAE